MLVSFSEIATAQNGKIDSLQRIVSLQRHDSTEANALALLAVEFLQRDLNKAKATAQQMVVLARSLSLAPQLGNGYLYLINAHRGLGKIDSALYYLSLLESHAAAHPEYWKIAADHNAAAGLLYRNTGQPKKALTYLLRNLAYEKLSEESKAGLMLNIGNVYFDLVDYKNCNGYYMKALALFEKLGNRRGQAYCLNSLGSTSLHLGQLTAAKNYLERSIQIKEELKDLRSTINSNNSLGDVYKELGQYEIAEKYYLNALKTSRDLKIPLDEARSLHQLGLLYKKTGRFVAAREAMKQSLVRARAGGDSLLSAKVKSALIGVDLTEQEKNISERVLLRNLNIIIQAGDKGAEAIEYNRLSEFYALDGQFDKAFGYLKKFQALNDSINNQGLVLQLRELEEKYNREKNEQEIALLRTEQELNDAELKRQRANQTGIGIALISVIVIGLMLLNRYRILNRTRRQAELEEMRQGIARDLHDDIGSTLSSINIMSQIAIRESDSSEAHLQKIAAHSSRMMENMSDIVWSINPGNDSVEQVVSRMKEFAAEILEPLEISYTFDIDTSIVHLKLDVEKRKNLFLIFKEAVNNAAKYSGAGSLAVRMTRENGTVHLLVHDNGKGFDPATIVPGNGLKNMIVRAKRMNGKLTQDSMSGKGSTISVEVPIT